MRIFVILALPLLFAACSPRSSGTPRPATPGRANAAPVRVAPAPAPAPPPLDAAGRRRQEIQDLLEAVDDAPGHTPSPESVSALLASFPTGDDEMEFWVISLLTELATEDEALRKPLQAKLVQLFEDRSRAVKARRMASGTLIRLVEDRHVVAASLLPAARKAVQDPEAEIQAAGRSLLGALANFGPEAAEEYLRATQTGDFPGRRAEAMTAVLKALHAGVMGEAEAFERIADGIADESPDVMIAAVIAAEHLGVRNPAGWKKHAEKLLAALAKWDRLSDGTKQSLTRVIAILSSADAATAKQAVEFFLARAEKDREGHVEEHTREMVALGGAGGVAATAVEEGVTLRLRSKDSHVRWCAVKLVEQIGQQLPQVAKRFVPLLEGMGRTDPEDSVLQYADRVARGLK